MRFAKRSLTFDAAYCAGAGLSAVLLAPGLASLFGAPTLLIRVLGVVTVVWAVILQAAPSRVGVRPMLRVVAAANASAAVVLAALAFLAPRLAAQALLAAVALEVSAFAVAQARAHRKLSAQSGRS